MLALLQLVGHVFTPKYDGDLRHVQFFLPIQHDALYSVPIGVSFLPERQLPDVEVNGRLQESVIVYIYRKICFDRTLFNEAALHCGLHKF
jgi:hypothetical protein